MFKKIVFRKIDNDNYVVSSLIGMLDFRIKEEKYSVGSKISRQTLVFANSYKGYLLLDGNYQVFFEIVEGAL